MIEKFYYNEKKIIFWILALNPLLDMIFTITSQYLNIDLPINQGIRGLILVYFLVKIRNVKYIRYILGVFVLLILSEVSSYIIVGNIKNIIRDASYIIKIMYFVTTFFYIKEAIKLKKIEFESILKGLIIGGIIICINILVSKVFGVGLKAYNDGRPGVKGFFVVVNTITAMLVMTAPIALVYMAKYKKYKYVGIFLLSCICLIFIGTKFAGITAIGLLVIASIYLLIIVWNTKYRWKVFSGIGVLTIACIVLSLGYMETFMRKQVEIYNAYGYNNLLDFITSNRTLQIEYVKEFLNAKNLNINPIYLLGIGFTLANSVVTMGKSDFLMIEMDFHGILYYSGILVLGIIIIIILVTILKGIILLKNRSGDIATFIILLTVIAGTLHAAVAGHVIYEAGPTLYFATVLGVLAAISDKVKFKFMQNKIEKIENKDIIRKFDSKLEKIIERKEEYLNKVRGIK